MLKLEIYNHRMYLADTCLSIEDIAHPADDKLKPITALLLIGDKDKLMPKWEKEGYKVEEKIIDMGDAFDKSLWNEKIVKKNKQQILFIQDNSTNDKGEKQYQDVHSGNFALVVRHFSSINDFLQNTETAYQFWLISQFSRLCIVSDDVKDSRAIAHAFAHQSLQLLKKKKIKFSRVVSDVNNTNMFELNSELTPNFQMLDSSLARRASAIIEATIQRKYAAIQLTDQEDTPRRLLEIKKGVEDYYASRVSGDNKISKNQSAVHKIRLITHQLTDMQNIIDGKEKYLDEKSMLLTLTLQAEHNLIRPEAWEERGMLLTKKTGGFFIITERKTFQMLLGLIGIDRQNVTNKAPVLFQDVVDNLPNEAPKIAMSGHRVDLNYIYDSLLEDIDEIESIDLSNLETPNTATITSDNIPSNQDNNSIFIKI